ncbi:hypothetical protein ACJ41O_013419 [Fusarium nematophilum]
MRLSQPFTSAALLLSGAAAGYTPGPFANRTFTPAPIHPQTQYYTGKAAETIVTTVTDNYVFYCPEPTKYVHKNVTYTATTATFLTITNCPCTVTYTQYPQPTYPPVVKTTMHGDKTEVVTYPPPVVPPTPGKPIYPPPPPGKPAPPAPGLPSPPPPVQPVNPVSPPPLPPATGPATTVAPAQPSRTVPAAVPSAAGGPNAGGNPKAGMGALVVAGVAAMVI